MSLQAPPPATENTPALSCVIPLYNEAETIQLSLDRLHAVLDPLGHSFELVFVDDGSKDNSAGLLISAAEKDATIRLVQLSRNFGKEAALTAGLDYARGDAVIIMDADLQDPPELIPEMLEHWQAGADVVLMQRRTREGETWLKKASAHLYYRLLRRLSQCDIPTDTGDFRLMSRRAVEALKQLSERNRYMKGLFAWIGMPTVVLLYDRHPRAAGQTKWGYFGLIQLAIQGITSFSIAPLRLATTSGLIAASLGALFGLWIVIKALVLDSAPPGYPSLIAIITFLGGIQLLSIGIVGEYVGRTYIESKQRPNYLVKGVVGDTGTPDQPETASHPIKKETVTGNHHA